VKFSTTLLAGETKNVVGIVIPPEIVAALGAGKRPPVRITLRGHTWRSTVAVMGGDFMVGVPVEHREKAGVKGGDHVEVVLELDDAPRTVEVPQDFAAALAAAGARDRFDALAWSHRKEHVRAIEEARAPATRSRRIEKAVAKILEPKN
jgi:bifunctional DNA-binding transcriptional regulator/antitoxin component of YhaV-PrlF toxin-antitoxin module